MKALRVLASLGIAALVAGCGAGTADPSSSNAAGAATTSSAASSPPSGASSSEVVPYEKLAALFPTIPGFKRESDPKGDTDAAEHVSRAQADYTQEGGGMGGLSVEMMDVSTNSVMLTPFKQIQGQSGTHKIGNGTQRSTTVAGFPAYEEWTPEAGNGVVGILIADRFLVTVTGSTVGKVDVIYKAIEAIDLKKIAALK
jgi:hypothetical protein